ncbi:MAG: cation:proton antiporter [Paracoccaceae bacterium]|nr:MAG: cation:proton antiporter [Paracoccaceae bacterium]
MDIAVLLGVLSGLIFVIALTEPVADRLRLPASVVLAVLGIAIGAGASWFWATPLTDALNPVALAILRLPISSDVFLYVFLPILIFQVSLTLNLRRMLDDWVPILTLAVVAVLVATAVIALALWPISGLPLIGCLLIAAIVSTTDPSAVVSIFRATPAPQRLARIVEGESLLNDAAAIALFGVFLTDVIRRVEEPEILLALSRFPFIIVAGAAVGWFMGRIAVAAMGRIAPYPLGQVTISLALPFASYILADRIVGASGVVAVVAAGMTVNFLAPGRLSPPALAQLRDAWGLMAYWAGGLIFVLAALLVPKLVPSMTLKDLGLILVTALAALMARALVLYGLLPLLTVARLSPRVDPPYRVAILWGGLRGAVTLALALAVTESFGVPAEVKRQVGVIAVGFTLITLLVQGTTLRPLIHWLGLDRLSPLDRALADQVVAVALQSVRETVAETTRQLDLQPAIVRDEAKRFGERLGGAVDRADEARDILDKDRVTLGLVALAGQERDIILAAFRDDLMPARLAERLLADADRLIEATRVDGRSGYRVTSKSAIRTGRTHRLAEALHHRLRVSAPLERLTEDRFEQLVALSQVLRALHGFIDRRILRIHGRRVADLLHDLLDRRGDDVDKALEGLRLQFPGYADRLERRLIRRTTLAQEAREYQALTEDGLIGPELHKALMAEVATGRATLAARPRLDLDLQKGDLVRRFPLFAEMEPTAQERLASRLRTVYVAPGDVILRHEEVARSVYFLASGAIEMLQAGQVTRLGRGEMFGELALLLRRARRARVTAITHCTLLVLDEARFLDLVRENPGLRRLVEERAGKRGVTLDPAIFAPRTGPGRSPLAWLQRALHPAE